VERVGYIKKPNEKKKCAECGMEFETNNPIKKYCTKKCYMIVQKRFMNSPEHKAQQAKYRLTEKAKELDRARSKKRNKSEKRRKYMTEYLQKYECTYRENRVMQKMKYRKDPNNRKREYARMLAKKEYDRLIPGVCPICNKIKRICMHHWDYNKPLAISFFCYECHKMADAGVIKMENCKIFNNREELIKMQGGVIK
jgi:hypothetical protein